MKEEATFDTRRADVAAIIAKGGFGAIPFVGPILAEIVGEIIPNQRLDRIADFLRILSEKLQGLEDNVLAEKMRHEKFVDLFEDGMFQAARALTRERKEYIASLLKNSITDDELAHIHEKRLLSILGQLNDSEILLLNYYSLKEEDYEKANAFYSTHEHAIQPPFLELQSSQPEIDRGSVLQTFRPNLEDLGLIRPVFSSLKKGELPEFDRHKGRFKNNTYSVTNLGKLLIRYLDVES